ncbi:hypothetical protein ACFW1I_29765, partial [Streptomyces sp. NPDC058955]
MTRQLPLQASAVLQTSPPVSVAVPSSRASQGFAWCPVRPRRLVSTVSAPGRRGGRRGRRAGFRGANTSVSDPPPGPLAGCVTLRPEGTGLCLEHFYL